MNQINSQEPAFETEYKIIVKSKKPFGIEYSKRAVDGKKYGHMNDYQSYESLSYEPTAKFLKSKNLTLDDVTLVMETKSLKAYETSIKVLKQCIKELN